MDLDHERITVLIGQLTSVDVQRRRFAAEALELCGDDALPALDALTVALDDDHREVRLAAVAALGSLDPREAELALGWATSSADQQVRIMAQTLLDGTAAVRGPDSLVWRDFSVSRDE